MSRLKSNAPRGSIFSQVKAIKTPQSRFNLSYVNKLTCNMGELIPFYVEDVVPGDKFDIRAGIFGRLQPMVSPVMQDIDIEVRYFYVPYRLLWKNFEDYMTGKGDHVFPYLLNIQTARLSDFFGANVDDGGQTSETHRYRYAINAMPYRAYTLIYKEFFIDENVGSLDVFQQKWDNLIYPVDGEQNNSSVYDIQRVSWKKDYFTSALPWTQRGEMADVIGDVFLKDTVRVSQRLRMAMDHDQFAASNNSASSQSSGSFTHFSIGNYRDMSSQGNIPYFGEQYETWSNGSRSTRAAEAIVFDPNGTLGVNIPISSLRMANAVQRFLERSALTGNRYSEYILGMFGVRCADSRLQRPEYLGGGKMPFTISPVLQQEQAQLDSSGDPYENSTPQGNLAGIGSLRGSFGINKPTFFPEYGLVMGLLYVRPRATYIDGLRRYMNVGVVDVTPGYTAIPYINDRLEQFYNPFFANLGEDAVLKSELKADQTVVQAYGKMRAGIGNDTSAIFGYQSRYAFMKYRPSEVHGDFRGNLKFWHLGREFSAAPSLNGFFLSCNPSNRIWAVEDDRNDKILLDIANVVDAVRPMPKYGTPTL